MPENNQARAALLDGRFFTSRERAHEILSAALAFPAYYGRNLDALADCLGDLNGVEIWVYFSDEIEKNLGPYGAKMLCVLRDTDGKGPRVILR